MRIDTSGPVIAGLVMAIAGCSQQPGGSTRQHAIAESALARVQLAQWRAELPLRAGVAKGFVRDGVDRLAPRFAGAVSARVTLPVRASGSTRVADAHSGVALEFALAGSTRTGAQVSGGLAWYGGAAPGGGDLIERAARDGVEDFVAFAKRPPAEQLEYRVDLSDVAGLRLVANTLELLDAGGAPRLRVARPYVVDSHGKRVAARLSLEGCLADTNPLGPWGRPVTPPGARSCTLRVTWHDVRYPALVDPGWTTTGSMATARTHFGAARLPNGQVIAMGGHTPGSSWNLASAELYDPGTGTWAGAASMNTARQYFTTTTLTNGEILVAAGSAEVYDPQTGNWKVTGSQNTSRIEDAAARMSDGRVMVAGGSGTPALKSVEIYNPASGQWSTAPDMATGRMYLSLTTLGDGRILAAGGQGQYNGSGLATAEIYDPGTGSWSSVPSMLDARYEQNAVTLSNGDALVIGGYSTAPLVTAERFVKSTSTWSAAGVMAQGRFLSSAALMADGRVLVSGGDRDAGNGQLLVNQTAEIYDPASNTWSSAGFINDPRRNHQTALLTNGRLLIVGGDNGNVGLASAELYDPGTTGTGGTGGAGGSGGAAGTGGTAGTGGAAGGGGTAGTGGSAGTGGTAGAGGNAGTAGTAGTSGSGGTSGNDGGTAMCVPQQQIECACGGGVKGYQVCQADGKSYGACVCKSPSSSNNKGGCGCRAPGRRPTNNGGLLLLAAGLLLVADRRRARRARMSE